MKRKFKERWLTIPQIWTKRAITTHFNPLNIEKTTYICPGLGQAQICDGVKPVYGILTHSNWKQCVDAPQFTDRYFEKLLFYYGLNSALVKQFNIKENKELYLMLMTSTIVNDTCVISCRVHIILFLIIVIYSPTIRTKSWNNAILKTDSNSKLAVKI